MSKKKCPTCHGHGEVYKKTGNISGADPDLWATKPCPDCNGTGYIETAPTPPAQPEDAARPQKPALNEIARIVNSHFLQTPYKGKDWEAVRKEIIEELCAHEYLKAQEELEEILDMATSNYNNTGNEDMRALANYCSNRIIQFREHPQATQPPAADTTKQGEGESDE